MGCGFGSTGALAYIIILLTSILGLILCITWIFLPWILMSKMDKVIELLKELTQKK